MQFLVKLQRYKKNTTVNNFNKNININFKKVRKHKLTVKEFVDGILSQNITILSRAITLIESNLPSDREIAGKIIEICLPHSGNSYRIGITGVPGVGKSTFIETFGSHLASLGCKLAVLAIDPSSQQSKGSILGDKTRMEQLSTNKNVYIRPSPSSGTLGGVARTTRETIILCEAAGFDTIFIETVGVGQSETTVNSLVDFFMLLMLAGAGDELQGIKRGIMELADTIVITKADSDNIIKANMAKMQFEQALHLFPPNKSGWTPKVMTASAIENVGIPDIWETILDYFKTIKENNFFEKNRKSQIIHWLHETIIDKLKSDFYENKERQEKIKLLEQQAVEGKISPFEAAKKLLATGF